MKKISKILPVFYFLFILLQSVPLYAEMTGREIMEKSETTNSVEDELDMITMELIDKKGKVSKRKMYILTKTNDQGNDMSLIRFTKPKNINRTGFLTIENKDRDDDQWLYLPAQKKIKRISSKNQKNSFMRTDFAYEDMSKEKMHNNKYTLLGTKKIKGQECYGVLAMPTTKKDRKTTGYSKREIWVSKKSWLPIQIKFYNKKGKLFKILQNNKIHDVGNGIFRARWVEMKNIKRNHKTIMIFDDIKINTGVSDSKFTLRELEKGD